MTCKICAAMTSPRPLLNPRRLLASLAPALLAGALTAMPAWAEKADRDKPLNIVSERGGLHDAGKQLTEFNGKVTLTKGTMQLRAETLSVREMNDGFVQALAQGRDGEPVSFRQARDVPGESIAGTAGQIEYDARADTVRFIGAATVRILRGSAVLREISGAVLVYDNRSERVSVEAGQSSPNPRGGVRMTIMPRGTVEPAAPASAVPLQAVPPVPRTPS
jgi:lipopolysaccharide export system protein LptA